jgi:cell division protease FtsH
VTIVPRGIAFLGATMQLPLKDKYHYTRKELEGQLAALMGGRIAEELVFDDLTSGAKSDIKQATELARKMVCEWGMSDVMGPLAYGEREEHLFLGREIDRHVDYSEETARKIDSEIRRLVDDGLERARALILESRDKLDAIAGALLKYEVLDGSEIDALIAGEPIRDERPDAAPQPVAEPAPGDTEVDEPGAAQVPDGDNAPERDS